MFLSIAPHAIGHAHSLNNFKAFLSQVIHVHLPESECLVFKIPFVTGINECETGKKILCSRTSLLKY